MKEYVVWFITNPQYKLHFKADTRDEARKAFADWHDVTVSSYIQARTAKSKEGQDAFHSNGARRA